MTNTTTCEFSGVSTYVDGINVGRCVTVENAEVYYADELYSLISDLSKEANGSRMRFDHTGMTFAELEKDVDYYSNAAHEAFLESEAAEVEDEAEFKALVQRTIELGAGDEVTALRWLTQDEEFYHSQSVENWVYNHGILFTAYGKELVTKLLDVVEYREAV